MKDLLKEPLNWVLSTIGTIILFFPITAISISDRIPVDGPLTVGYPFTFFTKGLFPPNEEVQLIALTLNIVFFFVISAISVFSIKIFQVRKRKGRIMS
ncbi:MAG: hypothetical protein ACXAC6_02270 [Candidatus Hodarchaeales archaeon]